MRTSMCYSARLFLLGTILGAGNLSVVSGELVGYWDFEENGGATVFDSSGRGHHESTNDEPASKRAPPIPLLT